ncbi:MAG: hypothetical protein ACREBU_06045 [Nitrososphaera sp.]
MKYVVFGLLIISVLFYFQPSITYSDDSPDLLEDDWFAVLSSRPFVTLGGMPRELYNVSDTLTITANLTTNDPLGHLDVVPIIEVRDSSDITMLLYSEAATIPAGGELNISLPWVPEKRDAYLIRVFVISDLINPRLLTEPLYWKTVVIEPGAKSIVDSVKVGNQTNGLPRIISETNISNSSIGSGYSYMYVQDDTICIVWLEIPPGIDYSPPGTPPVYRVSHDAGVTFSPTAELAGSNDIKFCDGSDSTGNDDDSHIELNQTRGLAYNTWGGNENPVFLTATVHNSSGIIQDSWSSQLAYCEMVRDMLIRAEGSNVYFFWSDMPYGHKERQLYFASSSDYGEHVTTTKLRSSLNGNSIYPTHLHLVEANNTILLLWSDTLGISTMYESDYEWKMFSVRSTDGGRTLSGLVDLIPDANSVFDPQLVYANGNLYLIWQEYDSNSQSDIFFAKSTDYGLTFREG